VVFFVVWLAVFLPFSKSSYDGLALFTDVPVFFLELLKHAGVFSFFSC